MRAAVMAGGAKVAVRGRAMAVVTVVVVRAGVMATVVAMSAEARAVMMAVAASAVTTVAAEAAAGRVAAPMGSAGRVEDERAMAVGRAGTDTGAATLQRILRTRKCESLHRATCSKYIRVFARGGVCQASV